MRGSFRTSILTLMYVLSFGYMADAQQPFPGWNFYNNGTGSGDTFLTDLEGNVVHEWNNNNGVAVSVYLIDNGEILRTNNDPNVRMFGSAGSGGRLQRIAWDNTIVWDYVTAGTNDRGNDYTGHHDVELLPNGNILFIAWERFSLQELLDAGRDPMTAPPAEIWSEVIYEVRPTGPTSGDLVWEWHAWDHLIQNFDSSLPNFGEPSNHPGRIDINYAPDGPGEDWLHFNAMEYNPQLDQIVVSSTHFDEFWVIDHAPGASGDIMYRFGNPQAYGRGTAADQRLWGQHNIQWIEPGLDGAGHFLVFNNGRDAQNPRPFSTVDELVPPVDANGMYSIAPGEAFGPRQPFFVLDNLSGNSFYSPIMSSAQRLPNGNTLFNLGSPGSIHEVDANGIPVWQGDTAPFTFRVKRIGTFDSRLEGFFWFSVDGSELDVVQGIQHSGSLQDTFASDDVVLDLRRGTGPIVVEFTGIAPDTTAQQLNLELESNHSLSASGRSPVSVAREVEFFNYISGQWELVNSGPSSLIESTIDVEVSDAPERFIEAGTGEVKARLTFTRTGLSRGTRITIDRLRWKIVNP